MIRRSRILPGLAIAAVTALAMAGCDMEGESDADAALDTTTMTPAQPAGQQAQETYEARLTAVGGSGVSGTATITRRDNQLQVTVAATGLPPNTRVPQHIHANASCDNAGGIVLNLDNGLTAANEGEPRGDAYPQSGGEGRLQYSASRSVQELRTAMQGAGGASGDSLNLANRVVNLHGANMQAIACGPLDRMGQTGQTMQPGDTAQTGTP